MRPSLDVAAADAYCGELADRHYENFTVASRVLQHDLRRDLARIYAYCRTTDDLGDESGGDARERLDQWRGEVLDLFAGRRRVPCCLCCATRSRASGCRRSRFST